jgi:hypothetical protein
MFLEHRYVRCCVPFVQLLIAKVSCQSSPNRIVMQMVHFPGNVNPVDQYVRPLPYVWIVICVIQADILVLHWFCN